MDIAHHKVWCEASLYYEDIPVIVASFIDHCSAPFSRAFLVGLGHQSLLGRRSRHCHGINFTNNPIVGEIARLHQYAALFRPQRVH
jgi:hypothetical protein